MPDDDRIATLKGSGQPPKESQAERRRRILAGEPLRELRANGGARTFTDAEYRRASEHAKAFG